MNPHSTNIRRRNTHGLCLLVALASTLACARSNAPNDTGVDASPDVIEEPIDPFAPCPEIDVAELITCGHPDDILSFSVLDPSHARYASYLDGCEHFLGTALYTFARNEELGAMRNLRVINSLGLGNNLELQSLAGVERLEEAGLLALRLGRPVSLEPLSGLRRVRDVFTLETSELTTGLAGLERLECVGELYVRSNQAWDLTLLRRLRRVEGDVSLYLPNVPREDIEAFIERMHIEGSIEVNGEIWSEM